MLDTIAAEVYLTGDPSCIYTTLTVEGVLAKLADAVLYEEAHSGLAFVRLPLPSGEEGLVRPWAIGAILPPDPEGDDD